MAETESSEKTNMGPVCKIEITGGHLYSNDQVYMFVSGLTVARFGLHLYDLCVIQLFQEGVRSPTLNS